jgi:hypothetical protein
LLPQRLWRPSVVFWSLVRMRQARLDKNSILSLSIL